MSQIDDYVSLTSRMMAAMRAIETQRPDRLFEDHLAAQLAGDELIAQVTPRVKNYDEKGTPFIPVRTRFFDDFLISQSVQMRQVVILGAGMDTRAFRLPWHPETHLYEVDRTEVLQTKESLIGNIAPKCHRHLLSIDLRQSWSNLLLEQGYQIEIPSVWLLEGLLYYLTETEVHDLLKIISSLSAPGSWLGADLINKFSLQSSDELAKYWRYGCDRPEDLFLSYQWQASVIQPGDEGANYGRFTYKFPPRDILNVPQGFFITASKPY